ncbi:SDR family NAD(P)-dependent oxidoreductase [Rhodoligotrophos defluvii]|uniref:SDR family NAD(P)-dependent oxidoreductase n=1 Tax=Rhodoligotrophos defluvii TaxID=2561934 RepID=UPI0010C9EE0D|nr:SDR family oxidoreductase [Rhodoligotrophos defluvii]
MSAGQGKLAGRRILITGAASGIGRAAAELFAQEGASLALLDQDEAGLVDLKGTAVPVDVSDEASVEVAIREAANALGGIDGLVNVAGIFPVAELAETTLDLWNRTLAVNLTGPFLVTRAVLPHLMKADEPTIVNLGSASAIVPYPELSAYGASKGGIAVLSKVWAAELAPKVRVNVVCPGMTRTRMVSDWHPDPDALAGRAKQLYALQRIAEPIEVANAILFLTSSDSSFVTGTTLVVDGGRTFH